MIRRTAASGVQSPDMADEIKVVEQSQLISKKECAGEDDGSPEKEVRMVKKDLFPGKNRIPFLLERPRAFLGIPA